MFNRHAHVKSLLERAKRILVLDEVGVKHVKSAHVFDYGNRVTESLELLLDNNCEFEIKITTSRLNPTATKSADCEQAQDRQTTPGVPF